MPSVDAYRARISYEIAGSGPTIVLVHGGDANSLLWFQQVPFFARYLRTITLNLCGFLDSTCAPEDAHPRHYPDDLLAVLDAERVERVALVCQSLGAWAGLPLANQHPDRIACLVLGGSTTPAYSPGNWLVLQRAVQTEASLRRGALTDLAEMGFAPDFGARRPDLAYLYFRANELNAPRDGALLASEEVRLYPKDLANYRVPTLVTGGAHDQLLKPENHKHVATLIPGAELHTFSNAGHSAYLEAPGDYNRAVGRFIARHLIQNIG